MAKLTKATKIDSIILSLRLAPMTLMELAEEINTTPGAVAALLTVIRRNGGKVVCRGGKNGRAGSRGKYFLLAEPDRVLLEQEVGVPRMIQIAHLPLPPSGWEPK